MDWLGRIPAHWDVDRIKRSAIDAKNGIWGNEPKQDENDIPCVRVADFDRAGLRVVLSEPTIRNVTENERSGRVLRKGDLLLEKSGGGEGQPVGCVVLYDDARPAVCSNFVARVRLAPEMNSSFWRYLHAAAYSVRINVRSIKQTSGIQNLDASQYFDERAGFPPRAEQDAIAGFLDSETAKIDALVAEQEKLMALLKEKRQAVISHAVTKGLDPAVPMKDSGVEWLGEVPAHWTVTPLGILASAIQTGPFGSQLHSDEYVEGGTPVINPSNIQAGELVPISSCTVNEEVVERLAHHKLRVGDIVFARRGEMGRCALVQRGSAGWLCGTGSLNVRLLPNALPEFVTAYLGSPYVRQLLELESVGSTMDNLNTQILSNVSVPTPPVSEQRMIVERASLLTTEIDGLIDQASRVSELLSERRAALISAAVTGKIDVRDTKKALAA